MEDQKSSSSDSDNIQAFQTLLNNLLVRCGSEIRIENIPECPPEVFLILYEGILGEKVPDFVEQPKSEKDSVHNVQCVIDSLSLDVLKVDLSHIAGEDVVKGDVHAICNLVEIFDGLMDYIIDKLENESMQLKDVTADPDEMDVEDMISIAMTTKTNNNLVRESKVIMDRLGKLKKDTPIGQIDVARWSHNNHALEPSSRFLMQSNNKEHSLVITEVAVKHAGKLQLQVSNGHGTAVSSAEVAVQLKELPCPPSVLAPLESVVVEEGQTVTFRTSVSGVPTPASLWLLNGCPLATSDRCFRRQCGDELSLVITDVRDSDDGRYSLEVDNPQGRVVTVAQLFVEKTSSQEAPTIRAPLKTTVVRSGQQCRLEVTFQSILPTVVTWCKEGEILTSRDNIKIFDEGSRHLLYLLPEPGFRHLLYLADASESDSGQYAVIIDNDKGRTVSLCHVDVRDGDKEVWAERTDKLQSKMSDGGDKSDPEGGASGPVQAPFFRQPLQSVAVPTGQSTILSLEVLGHPLPEVQFQCNGTTVQSSNDYSVISNRDKHTLRISNIQKKHYGKYVAIAENRSGVAMSTCDVTPLAESMKGDASKEEEVASLSDHTLNSDSPTSHLLLPDVLLKPEKMPSRQLRQENVPYLSINTTDTSSSHHLYDNRQHIRDIISSSRKEGELAESLLAGQDSGDKEINDLLEQLSRYRKQYESGREKSPPMRRNGRNASKKLSNLDDLLDRRARDQMQDIRKLVDREDQLDRYDDHKLATSLGDVLARLKLAEEERLSILRKKVVGTEKDVARLKKTCRISSPRAKYDQSSRVTARRRADKASEPTKTKQKRMYAGDPQILEEHDLLPYLFQEFPHLSLAPETTRKLWRKQLEAVETLSQAPTSASRIRKQVEEVERRQEIGMKLIKKELDQTLRVRDKKAKQDRERALRCKVRERKQASARVRRYYDELDQGHRSRMMKRRTREEVLFRKLFDEGLTIQKQRIRELRKYAKEKREIRADRHKLDIESMENYYKDQFDLLAEAMAVERKDLLVRERAQTKVVSKLKIDLRHKLEADIRRLQEQLCKDDDGVYHRQLEVDRIRGNLQKCLYRTDV